MSEMDRMTENLFHSSEQIVCNVKFFLGDKRATSEDVAAQVNIVSAQKRTGNTELVEKLDSNLKDVVISDFLTALN